MNCKTFEMFLYNYLDNETQEQESFELEVHLEKCQCCRNLYNYEAEFHNYIKSKMKEKKVDVPLDLKNKILSNKKQFHINYNAFSLKGLASVSIILFSVVFLSKVSMGYSTVSENYGADLLKDIKIVSNNEVKLNNWIKKHDYKNFKLLSFDKNKLKLTPLGLAFNKKKVIVYYHYKGNKLAYKNMEKLVYPEENFKEFKVKNKTFFIKKSSDVSIAVWNNKNGTSSCLEAQMPESQLKEVLYSLK